MLALSICKDLILASRRCVHHDTGQILTRKNIQSKTSGIIVTGDEVLKGQVIDTNSYFLCRKLYDMGIKVMAISKIADEVGVIAEEVKKFSRKYDYVITTGGIGPTHDDVTYKAVAMAFNDELHQHPEVAELVFNFYKTNDLNHPALKMACIPSSAKITYGFDPVANQKTLYPNISVKNVFIFPGVPHLCERLFNLTKDQLFFSAEKFHSKELYILQSEGFIVHQLNDAVKKYPNVTFGSYPEFFHSYYNVKITMESIDKFETNEAFQYLQQLIPKEYLVEYDKNPFSDKMHKINNNLKDKFFFDTLNELQNLFRELSPNDIFLYFDGGKNSTIIVHIVSALFEKLFPGVSVNAIYVEKNPKVNHFVNKSVKNYDLKLLKLSESNFKNFAKSSSTIRIIKGIRKTDPDALNIAKSFEGLKLINPLFNWRYNDVWKTIRSLYLPYCELYDQGYTSVCQIDSSPNPNLRTTGPRKDLIYYKKAFELEDESLECTR